MFAVYTVWCFQTGFQKLPYIYSLHCLIFPNSFTKVILHFQSTLSDILKRQLYSSYLTFAVYTVWYSQTALQQLPYICSLHCLIYPNSFTAVTLHLQSTLSDILKQLYSSSITFAVYTVWYSQKALQQLPYIYSVHCVIFWNSFTTVALHLSLQSTLSDILKQLYNSRHIYL